MDRIVVIDVETTGLDPYKGDRIVEIAALEIINGEINEANVFHSYINPEGKKISKKAGDVHGIKNEKLINEPTFKEVANEFVEFIQGATLSTYNRRFDFRHLQCELDRANIDVQLMRDFNSNCLMVDVANKINNGTWLKLDIACRRFNIDISLRKVHGALIDAVLAAKLYIKLHFTDHTPEERARHVRPQAKPTPRPIPRAFTHPITGVKVQLNHCKNPDCKNYMVPAQNPEKKKDGTPKRGLGNDYVFTTTGIGKVLTCKLCRTSTVLINNKAFTQESIRVKESHAPTKYCCTNSEIKKGRGKGKPCVNFDKDVFEHPEAYAKKGKKWSTVKGQSHLYSQRFECKSCGSRFYVRSDPQMGQQSAHINKTLFSNLINKGIINRLQESFDIDAKLIYNRIEFFYRQCIEFDQWHIERNLGALSNTKLELSMDRQHYLANWNDKADSRPTKLVNTSTVENKSRFVLASTLNFDITSDWEKIQTDHKYIRDWEKPRHQRKYPQYTINDLDVESDDVEDSLSLKAPAKHLLVQQTYSLMAHLETIKPYYEAAGLINLFADDDEGFELGISLVMSKYIKEKKLYPVLIRAERNNASQMQDKRTWSEQALIRSGISQPDIDEAKENKQKLKEINLKYWSAAMLRQKELRGDGKSEWITHPFPTSKSTIEIKPLVGTLDEVTLTVSETLLRASTNGVDNYFQMLRRRINMLERPITSATNGHRWNGYASYNPKWLVMLIEIMRVYNNYVLTDEKRLRNRKRKASATTPAQKLGISDKKYSIDDILSFSRLNEKFSGK